MPTLRFNGGSGVPLEAESLTPDRRLGLSADEIARLPAWHGNRRVEVGEFFAVSDGGEDVVLEGDLSRVKGVGAKMTAGRLVVRGSVGMHAGAEMAGGELVVHGDAGMWLGAEMRGGLIRVHGNAGDLAGAAYRGSRRGVRGGEILIGGDAGEECGILLRRGLIAVGGRVGDFAGGGMIAGTLIVFGPAGRRAGAGMKRGTLAFLGPPPELLPTFADAGPTDGLFLELYLRRLRALGFAATGERAGLRRYCGDRVSLGKGEILARG